MSITDFTFRDIISGVYSDNYGLDNHSNFLLLLLMLLLQIVMIASSTVIPLLQFKIGPPTFQSTISNHHLFFFKKNLIKHKFVIQRNKRRGWKKDGNWIRQSAIKRRECYFVSCLSPWWVFWCERLNFGILLINNYFILW